jgi:glycosyltransferase involved in cell wall biosynthesis
MEVFPISLLVRCFNSGKTLPRLLDKLDLRAGDEVIVVDSGSQDRTLEIAEARGARVVHAPPPFNYSKSLNIGFRAARHPWVLVISSHAVPLVANLLGAYREAISRLPEEVVVVYGPCFVDGNRYRPEEDGKIFDQHTYRQVLHLCGNANTLYRRSIWEAIPFDEAIRTQEDKEWIEAAMAAGKAMTLVSAARAINLSAYSLRYAYRKGYSDAVAAPHRPLTRWELAIALASHVKRYLTTPLPWGNFVRALAHQYGGYCGTHQSQNNSPTGISWK